ncbi:MAG: Pyruvate formate-lyase-activating enzyme [Chlamydiae bacterium]|nr:Pyruvate formate-lyase-activating enzyme [Chlamydiota bacterium]
MHTKIPLLVEGITSFTTIDYPGYLSAVIFCKGCPWRCRYCHNPNLQAFSLDERSTTAWDDVLDLLEKRKKLLDGVVFSGGEALMQPNLKNAIMDVKSLGFKIGLHTAGCLPKRLEEVLPLLDWIGMDIKAPFDKYENVTQVKNSGKQALESTELILKSECAYEFRTTVHRLLLSEEDIRLVAKQLLELGAKNFVLQNFRPKGCIDTQLVEAHQPLHFDSNLCLDLKTQFEHFTFRS